MFHRWILRGAIFQTGFMLFFLERFSDWLHVKPSGPAMTPKVISVVSGRGILGVMVVVIFFSKG